METRSKYRPGRVRDAIVTVLEHCDTPMGVREIHRLTTTQLGEAVPASSVRSSLALNEAGLFRRVRRGQYMLNGFEAQAPMSVPRSEVWRWSSTELHQGDCVGWLRSCPPNTIHGVVTDPPYGLVEYEPGQLEKMRARSGGVWRIPPSFDGHERSPLPRFTTLSDLDRQALTIFFQNWAHALMPVLVPGANVVVASNPLLSFLVSGALASAGFERRGEIVRLVMTMRGGDRPKNAHDEFSGVSVMPRSMWEPWLLFRKPLEGRVQDNLRKWRTGGFRRISESQPFGDVIASHPTRAHERRLAPHPSLKPQAFLRQVVRAVLPLGEGVVLDPFAGAGSTLAAAETVGYPSIGVELNPDYFALAREAVPRLTEFKC